MTTETIKPLTWVEYYYATNGPPEVGWVLYVDAFRVSLINSVGQSCLIPISECRTFEPETEDLLGGGMDWYRHNLNRFAPGAAPPIPSHPTEDDWGRLRRHAVLSPASPLWNDWSDYQTTETRPPDVEHPPNVITSATETTTADGAKHLPCLDLDFDARLIPSRTAGHFHLYLDGLPITWKKYRKLIKALAKAGVIEKGYAKVSLERGFTSLRDPVQ